MGKEMENVQWEGISHVLLDIEGTTCPVSYVAETLFPYASANLASYLEAHQEEPSIRALLEELETVWQEEVDQEAIDLLSHYRLSAGKKSTTEIVPYLQFLIRNDRKLTSLKDLQGRIWAEGYARGELIGPLYEEVPTCLKTWHQQGFILAVYSSGSVTAQQLLYRHSSQGDLSNLFSHWFDTRMGSKHDPNSYTLIAKAMECDPKAILFVSDSDAELLAASQSGLPIVCSQREINEVNHSRIYPVIHSFHQILLKTDLKQQ